MATVIILCALAISYAQSLSLLPVGSTLSRECLASIQSGCIPTAVNCADAICYLCTSLDIQPSIEPCCAAATPAACFATNYVHGVTMTVPPVSLSSESVPSFLSTLPAERNTTLTELSVSCQSQASVYEGCKVETPNFDDLSFSDLQSCLCTSSGRPGASVYDDYFSGCLEYASLFDPPEYSAQGPTGGAIVTGIMSSLTDLGSRPCESYAAITASRTATPSSSTSILPSVSDTGSVVSHGITGGGNTVNLEAQCIIVLIIVNIWVIQI